ncbi:hypothetical protein B0H13DRAFT_2313543 [Mycena leptocephala]|nr:hypothetical protein B0H13DRAFT_2313543 [Mycena leptocephala]
MHQPPTQGESRIRDWVCAGGRRQRARRRAYVAEGVANGSPGVVGVVTDARRAILASLYGYTCKMTNGNAAQSWLEERYDGDSRLEPQEPESELGGGKAVTRECAHSQLGRGVQQAATGLETAPGGAAVCKGRELEDGDERWKREIE